MNSYKYTARWTYVYRILLLPLLLVAGGGSASEQDLRSSAKQRNIIFVLTDDQRYDELGFLNPVLETPNMDMLANEGSFFKNAFVTTSLCSPSRASILTGQYMHNHGVIDNNRPPKPGLRYFPQYLQGVGYETAFFGKWHMGGHHDDPQPGFDHWVSFAGQGEYYPVVRDGKINTLNVNGNRVPQKGYITDELTDYTLEWLQNRQSDKPFFAYLSHKAVHAMFRPAERHKEQYSDAKIPIPHSQADSNENYQGKPMWVKNQRNSWHGVDFPYHSSLDVQEYKRQYHRTLSAVDDSLGRLLLWLKDNNLEDNTLVVLMGDNGFMFGEHGLIDKRNAYEESMRVPLLTYAPGFIPAGHVVEDIVANVDIAPTLLEVAGIPAQEQFDGQSFLAQAQGKKVSAWRDSLLYEYYWEFNYPHTPTTFALRGNQYKYIQYHGVWDTEELYDLDADPKEMRNLIYEEEYFDMRIAMRKELFEQLTSRRNEHSVPFSKKFNHGAVFREADRSKAAQFPESWQRKEGDRDLTDFFYPDSWKSNKLNVKEEH